MAAAVPKNGLKDSQELLNEAEKALANNNVQEKDLTRLCLKLLHRFAIDRNNNNLLNRAIQLKNRVENQENQDTIVAIMALFHIQDPQPG